MKNKHDELGNTLHGFVDRPSEKAKLERRQWNESAGAGRGPWGFVGPRARIRGANLSLCFSKLAEMHTKKGELYCTCCDLRKKINDNHVVNVP